MFFDRNITEDFRKVERGVKAGFDKIRDEMDNHLDSINQNTDEINSVYDYLAELEGKMNKISERIDHMEMMVNPSATEPLACNIDLNRREQEVFMVLYTADDKVTTNEMAKKLGFTEEMVINYLYNLIAKGVPVVKECIGSTMLLSLNNNFKELQTKKNILKIKESVVKELV